MTKIGCKIYSLTIRRNYYVRWRQYARYDPSVIDPEDKEMLEDLIVAAVNEAGKKVDDMMAQEMSKITGGMNLPGMF